MAKFSILPYVQVDGVPTFRDSEILALYDRVFKDEIDHLVFHDGGVQSREHFLELVKTGKCHLYVPMDAKGQPMGMVWINRLEMTSCHVHFVFFRRYWGTELIVDVGKAITHDLLQSFPVLLGRIPWWNDHAQVYAQKCGWREIATIDHLIWSEKEQKTIIGVVVCITREDLDYENL